MPQSLMSSFPVCAVFGAGFIGRSLIRQLIARGEKPNVLDHNPCIEEFAGQTCWYTGEFGDQRLLKRALEGVDVAYHLISNTVPGDDRVDLVKELADNIFSTLAFLDTCRICKVKRVVFVSSSSVYGIQPSIPTPETVVTNPISSHGIQKLTIEKYLLLYQLQHDVDVRIIRLANPYGPDQKLYGRQGFIALAIGSLLKGSPILLRDMGKPVRDFIFIDDVATALVLAGTNEDVPQILNIGSGVGYSISQVVGLIEQLIDRPILKTMGEIRRVDIPVSLLDVSLANRSLSLNQPRSLREGLKRTLRFHGLSIANDTTT